MTNCNRYKNMISLYIDDMLNEKEKNEFLQHIKECSNCTTELDQMQQLVSLCNSLPEEDLPENFKLRLHEKLAESNMRTRKSNITDLFGNKYIRMISTAAACLVVVFAARGMVWWNSVSLPEKNDHFILSDDAFGLDDSDSAEKNEHFVDEFAAEIYSEDIDNNSLKSDSATGDNIDKKDTPEVEEEKMRSDNSASFSEKSESQSLLKSAIDSKSQEPPEEDGGNGLKTHASGSGSDIFTISASNETETVLPKETSRAFEGGKSGIYIHEYDVVILSLRPLAEIEPIKTRAGIYGVNFISASPQGIIDAAATIKDEISSEYSPSVITLACKIDRSAFDQFIASLRTYYPKSAINVGPVNIIDNSARYEEIKNDIAVVQNKIISLENSDIPEKNKLINDLKQQLEQHKNELQYLEDNSKFINLRIAIQTQP